MVLPENVTCCMYGSHPASILIVPKRGTWSRRDVYEVCQLAQNYQEIRDIKLASCSEGGFAFPGTPESTDMWYRSVYSNNTYQETGECIDQDMRTYGVCGPWAQDWRTLPDHAHFDKPCEFQRRSFMQNMVEIKAKFCVPMPRVLALFDVIQRLGHHIVKTEGFIVLPEGQIVIGRSKKKTYMRAGQVKRLQKQLGVSE